jgi:hypothetical protein
MFRPTIMVNTASTNYEEKKFNAKNNFPLKDERSSDSIRSLQCLIGIGEKTLEDGQ